MVSRLRLTPGSSGTGGAEDSDVNYGLHGHGGEVLIELGAAWTPLLTK